MKAQKTRSWRFWSHTCNECGWRDEYRDYCMKCSEKREQMRLEKVKQENAKQEREFQMNRDKKKREHELKMQQFEAQKAKEQRDDKNESIKHCKSLMKKFKREISSTQSNERDLSTKTENLKKELKDKEHEIKQFDISMTEELLLKHKELDIDRLKTKLKKCEEQISGAIEKTCVSESNIARFLHLAQNLAAVTMTNQMEIDTLSTSLDVFAELIAREGSGTLTVEYYLGERGMKRFVPILASEDMNDMEDCVCADDDDFKEFMEMITEGLKSQHEEWTKKSDDEKQAIKEPKTKLTLKEKNWFKKICKQPTTWQDIAQSKAKVLKQRLDITAPVYSIFYQRIGDAMEQAESLLGYNDKLTETQQAAISSVGNQSQLAQPVTTKAIKAANTNDDVSENKESKDNESKDDEDKKTDNINDGNGGDKEEKEAELKVMKIMKGMDGTPVGMKLEESIALRDAAVHKIHVVESMNEMIGDCGAAGQMVRSAVSKVEHSCMKIITCHADIRQSVLLSRELGKLKPASLSDKAQVLWAAIDKGVIQIFDTALKLNKASQEYFGFFAKFRQSFGYYLTAKDEPLMVSTEYLKRDIKSFSKFSKKFEKQVSLLGDSAMKCIKDCVSSGIGAAAFENAQKERQQYAQQLQNALARYEKKRQELVSKADKLFCDKTELEAKIETNKLIIDSLQKQLKSQQEMQTLTVQTLNKLIGQKAPEKAPQV